MDFIRRICACVAVCLVSPIRDGDVQAAQTEGWQTPDLEILSIGRAVELLKSNDRRFQTTRRLPTKKTSVSGAELGRRGSKLVFDSLK
jgi:hypothetical protein